MISTTKGIVQLPIFSRFPTIRSLLAQYMLSVCFGLSRSGVVLRPSVIVGEGPRFEQSIWRLAHASFKGTNPQMPLYPASELFAAVGQSFIALVVLVISGIQDVDLQLESIVETTYEISSTRMLPERPPLSASPLGVDIDPLIIVAV